VVRPFSGWVRLAESNSGPTDTPIPQATAESIAPRLRGVRSDGASRRLREGDHAPEFRWLDGPGLGRVLVEREMGPGLVVVVEVGGESPPQRGLAEGDDVIQTLAANCTDDAFDIASLPGRSRSGEHFSNAEILNLFGEVGRRSGRDLAAGSVARCSRGRPREAVERSILP
jgi:hypothetical protein